MNTSLAFQHLGGERMLRMTGCTVQSMLENLTLRLTRNKLGAQFLTVNLGSDDLYILQFAKFRAPGYQWKEVKKITGVFCEDLRRTFEEETGLITSLNAGEKPL